MMFLYLCRPAVEALSLRNTAPPPLTEEPSSQDVPALDAGDTTEQATTQAKTTAREHVTMPVMESAVQTPRPIEGVIAPT